MLKPRAHQEEFINLFTRTQYKGLIAFHSMGSGKTYSTLLLARYYLAKARQAGYASPKFLILCPKSAITTWRAESAKLTPDIARDMVLLPYSQLKRAIKMIASSVFPWVLLGLDECHYLKTPGTDRIKDFSLMLDAIYKSKHGDIIKVMPMTGTPFPNNAAEIYTMWALCTAKNLQEASQRIIDTKYFEMWRGGFTNQREVKIKRKDPLVPGRFLYTSAVAYDGVANSDLMHQLISPIVHYVRKEDCLDLPPSQNQFINLNLPDDKLLANANVEKEDAYMSQLRVIAELKTPYMLEWVNEFLKLGEQLVVFSLFTTPLRILAQRFPQYVRLITGRESQFERDEAVRAFQSGKLKILALSYKAGSESLNLQNAHNSFYLNFPWNDDTLKQAMARTDRSGQTKPTNHYFMVSGENDEACFARVERKREANVEIKDRLLADKRTGIHVQDMLGLLEQSNEVVLQRGWDQAVENTAIKHNTDLSFGGLL